MGKDWDYAQMSKRAAEAGGPDAWIEIIKKTAYENGASDMKNRLVVPLLMTGIAIGAVGVVGYQKINKWLVEKKNAKIITDQEATVAEEYLKKELADAIEEFRMKE